ncbi:MAG: hypothetical protein MUE50_20755 [Pirellulaceae bacterium]|nr:hypothetical protein [Pirellulaceae bacterium]
MGELAGRRTWWLMLALLGWQLALAVEAAPPTLEHLFPAGAARGQAVTLGAAGQLPAWPLDVWTDRRDVTVQCGDKQGELQVAVAADAAPGVCWLRLFNADGASGRRPLVIGTLPEVLEQEPNDSPDKTQAVSLPATVNGRLEKNGDVDAYAADLRKGQTLVASLLAHRVIGSPMDGVLQICDRQGFVLRQIDDACGLDPQTAFVAPRDDRYGVRVFAFPDAPNSTIAFAGGPGYVYRLTLTAGGFLDSTMPLAVRSAEPTESQAGGWNLPAAATILATARGDAEQLDVFHPQWAGWLRLPATPFPLAIAAEPNDAGAPLEVPASVVVSGCVDRPGDVDAFRFAVRQGQRLAFRVESRSLGYPLDAILELTDAAGQSLAKADDAGEQADPQLIHEFRADGPCQLILRDAFGHGGSRYAYRVTIQEARPDFVLRSATEAFVLTAGQTVEIPVAVERTNGFGQEIEVRADGLPEGVKCEPAVSRPEGDSAKSVKLKLTSSGPAGSGVFSIRGLSQGNPSTQRTARFAIGGTWPDQPQGWLTVR